MAEQKSSSALTAPLRNAASAVRKVPGAGAVTKAAEGTLDKIGAVSPRGRRMAVYAGAGVLGVAGVVEWPVALTGAAVAWLTQPRPGQSGESTAMKATTPGTTEGSGHGAYVAMGDAATEPGPGAGVAGPGPLRGDEMPDGPAAASAGPATTAAAAAALGPDVPVATPHDQPAPADLDRPTGQHRSTDLGTPAGQDTTAGPSTPAGQDTAGLGGSAEQDTAAEPGATAEPFDPDPYEDTLAPPAGSTAPAPADEDDAPLGAAPPADPTAPPVG